MALTKEQIKKFQEAEAESEDFTDIKKVAENIAKAGDKKWAKELYEKAEEMTNDSYELQYLASDICRKLGDKEWAIKVYGKTEGKIRENQQFLQLAEHICQVFYKYH